MQEIFFPIYFVGILAMIKVFLPLDPQPAIPSIPLVHPQNFTPKYSQKILVCPNDTTTQSLAGDAAAIFQQILGLNTTPSLEFYQNDVDMVAAFKEKYSSIEGYLLNEYILWWIFWFCEISSKRYRKHDRRSITIMLMENMSYGSFAQWRKFRFIDLEKSLIGRCFLY